MSAQPLLTIEEFYKNIGQKRLMGGKCKHCGKVHLPPRPLCDQCLSKEFEWVEFPKTGELLTYTVIHVAPVQFQNIAPYAVGIVKLESGVKIPGIIKVAAPEQLKIGMQVTLEFDDTVQTQQQWPQWSKYYFKPL